MSSSPATIAPPSAAATVVVGTGPVSFADVVAVARHGATVVLSATTRWPRSAAPAPSSRRLADDVEPHYGVSTGFGALATRHIPAELRAQLQRSLIRSHAAGSGAEVEREVVRALMLLRLSTLATGRTGVRRGRRHDLRRAAQRRHHPGRARVRHPRLLGRPRAAGALRARADGRGRRCATPPARCSPRPTRSPRPASTPVVLRREGGPRADQRHRRHARHAGAGRRTTCALLLAHGRHHRRDERRGAARHRRGVRRRPAGAAPAPGPGRVARPTCGRCWPAPRSWRATAGRSAPACRTPTRCAARRRCTARARDTVDARGDGRRPRAGRRHRQPGRHAATAGSSRNGNFHGAPVGYVLDFLAIAVADLASISERRTDRFLDVARNARPAAVPRRRPGRRLRAHDRAVHAGRDRLAS